MASMMSWLLIALLFLITPAVKAQTHFGEVEPQQVVPRVAFMPNLPQPLAVPDWRTVTRQYDHTVFSVTSRGQYLPIVWFDNTQENFPWQGFGLPAYVGEVDHPGSQQAITCLSAVLSATLVGMDKSQGAQNWVRMSEQFFNRKNGEDMVLNNPSARTGGSFWYEIWPNILFDGLADYYPHVANTSVIMQSSADQWAKITHALTEPDGAADFDHTSFSLQKMIPVDNGRWKEPDGASGVSYLETLAYARYHAQKYLAAADAAQKFLATYPRDPLYELLEPYGAYAAARLNAEQGRHYDVAQQVAWAFGPSETRPGWGAIVGNWGGDDCDGLLGSTTDCDGYAFTMNTFSTAGALVPLVRYDQRFADAVGKWMLNAANAARLFYPQALPASHQSCPGWTGDPLGCIAYEGLRHHFAINGQALPTPYASGDPIHYHWGPPTDFGLYGSSHVGFFGGIIQKTSDPAILQLDCLKTDFFHQKADPTFLFYNPYPHTARVTLAVGAARSNLYDLVCHRFFQTAVSGHVPVFLSPHSATVIVITPVGGSAKVRGHTLFIQDVAVDFRADEP